MGQTAGKKFLTGARATVKVNGNEIGRAVGINVDYQMNRAPVETLGDPYAEGFPLLGVAVNFTVDAVKINILDEDWAAKGYIPPVEAAELLDWDEVEFVVQDKFADVTLFTMKHCAPNGYGFNVQARTIGHENGRWVARELHFGSQTE
jgi:hypothetical protein